MKRTFSVVSTFFFIVFPIFSYAQTWEPASLEGIYFSSIEKTSYGIMAGELDTRNRPETYNGIYITKDYGQTWAKFGLEGRGISCLDTNGNLVVAGTYYTENNQGNLFILREELSVWESMGFTYNVSAVAILNDTIYVGTTNHGLWITQDQGQSWLQKIGSGVYGPHIQAILATSDVIIASTSNQTYKSVDNGINWETVTPLNGKNIKHMANDKDTIAVGTFTSDGIYISKDKGTSWEKSYNFGQESVGGLKFFKGCLFAGKADSTSYNLYKSCNLGQTWESFGIVTLDTSTRVNDLELVYSSPDLAIISVNGEGLKTANMDRTFKKNPIFTRPWSNTTLPLIDYITSYFDHEYPLMASGIAEPLEAGNTTYNFLGQREKEPTLYYSSHNGTDFKLPYGTPILAVADGMASYKYCVDCGNTVVINHQNGYQTQYMHLQDEDLITTTDGVFVTSGQVIGKVGMTGRTTGPHLHFVSARDKNDNASFSDEFPWGLTDPFGWQSDKNSDPWPLYALGQYKGIESTYLWNEDQNTISSRISWKYPAEVNLNNLHIRLPPDNVNQPVTVTVQNYVRPKNPLLFYIPSTSFLIETEDIFGQRVTNFNAPLVFTYSLTDLIPDFIDLNTLSAYFWNEISNAWDPLESTFDVTNFSVTFETDHLSHFAVFGEIFEEQKPHTTNTIQGESENGWFRSPPIIYLETNSSNAKILYSINDTQQWKLYTEPIEFINEGINNLLFKSISSLGVEEPIQEIQIRLDTSGKWRSKLLLQNSLFNTQPYQ
ncbi:peptidoglycan DD-metalloendopeptidase family protein [candidate division WWE3 bacterium]|uniref:Peptidoglycan DD-metalloendopeptidase family protein n=1 Tax=candidate division WWE3 bacterium TaxID=2053526 RepID=A0A7X9HI21_UNCKA|nr:peptidoglycan DD-metalloendopeptidase family protein [candidate division WWE3 bacterium]